MFKEKLHRSLGCSNLHESVMFLWGLWYWAICGWLVDARSILRIL